MTRDLWLKLVLPLVVLSAIALMIHHWWDYGGLLVNLATGLVVVVVTVSYVEWVIGRHEAERWRGTEARMRESLDVFINAVVSSVRVGLGFGVEIMDKGELCTGDLQRAHQEVLRVAEHVLGPQAHARVKGLDKAGWKNLATELQSMCSATEHILDKFSHRLRPRQIELLLDIESSIKRALIFWQVFPDLAGVPHDQLPQSNTPPELLQAHGCSSTAQELSRLMTLAIELDRASQALPADAPMVGQ